MSSEPHRTSSDQQDEDVLEKALNEGGQLPGTDDSDQQFEGTTDSDRPDDIEDDERASGADVR